MQTLRMWHFAHFPYPALFTYSSRPTFACLVIKTIDYLTGFFIDNHVFYLKMYLIGRKYEKPLLKHQNLT